MFRLSWALEITKYNIFSLSAFILFYIYLICLHFVYCLTSVGMFRIHKLPPYHFSFGPLALTLKPEVQKISLHLPFLSQSANDQGLFPIHSQTALILE